MTLVNWLRGRYEIKCWCKNCNTLIIKSVPRGLSSEEFLYTHPEGVCDICGCDTLDLYEYEDSKKKEDSKDISKSKGRKNKDQEEDEEEGSFY